MAFKPTKKHIQICYDAGIKRQKRSKLYKALGLTRYIYYKHTELSESYKKGREDGTPEVVFRLTDSLLKECFGYHIEEKTKDGTVTKYMRPNMTGIMFALVNLNPEKWQSINKEKIIVDREKQSILINYTKYSDN